MATERDALVTALLRHFVRNSNLPEWMQMVALGQDMRPLAESTADALLASPVLTERPRSRCWRHDYHHREYVCTCEPPVAGDTGRDDKDRT